jgi:putative endonuclease
MKSRSTTAIGQRAEQQVAHYLESCGVQRVVQNYRCRAGEIDLIGIHQETLLFIEVRYRSSNFFGTGAESIDLRKQQRIILTAQHFLQHHPEWQDKLCRFDAVIVSPTQPMEWITDAFQIE